ncbi:hypothetical protein Pmar_PMAR028833 [Perkinsus marinus ATCC 50983]|uniref:Uncharacterized protein n=1 Tax=Perkinsus marinus (strain ATCC 50983 / TXsc) TaxID=423536 RepID=C5LGM6_PERM5|nr:hypothetical protein Pmar_PMAR028833 [Perkinsus marinus ATCC 50983]EER04118.1 hypothetical protein Pmar_PMAR028833 [Perkinsus marinus ATCC 50983]|eukprot:XP_002772302.1 hypothetical protein Pmar_PMAR028833 [Perkinsus marinus ATCC 50983]
MSVGNFIATSRSVEQILWEEVPAEWKRAGVEYRTFLLTHGYYFIAFGRSSY